MPPNRAVHEGRSAAGYTYPKGRLLPSCFGLAKFSGFHSAKTSANKRFYNMPSCLTSGATVFKVERPLRLQSYYIFFIRANTLHKNHKISLLEAIFQPSG